MTINAPLLDDVLSPVDRDIAPPVAVPAVSVDLPALSVISPPTSLSPSPTAIW